MHAITLSHADVLMRQGIAALQAKDTARARTLLRRALEIAPHNEQSWLWLSGAVANAAERRYCLERVLVINPHNTAALRGLALLPATLPVSPFPEDAPSEPVQRADWGRSFAQEPQQLAAAGATSAGSLIEIIARPDATAVDSASTLAQPPAAEPPHVVTFAPPPIAGEPPAGATSIHDPATVAFVVREYGRHRGRDEIIRALSEQYHMAWPHAQALVATIEREQQTAIARRQSPLLIFLGVATIIGGLLLAGRGIFVLAALYAGTPHGSIGISSPRAIGIVIGQMVTGVAMVLGATLGLGQTIKGLFR